MNMRSSSLSIVSIASLLLVAACSADAPPGAEAEPVNVGESESALVGSGAELAYPAHWLTAAPLETATVETNYGLRTLKYRAMPAVGVVDGDIILGDISALRSNDGEEGAGRVSAGARWPRGVIPYTLDENLGRTERVTDAMAEWQEKTGIRFVARTNENDYLTFRKAPGCSSYVGKTGGQQFVNVGDGCSTGNMIHEIGHAVGLWHEQSRADRDTYVTVHLENVDEGFAHNFETYIQSKDDGVDVSGYDFGSVMHYPTTAFSKNGQPTIEVKDPGSVVATIGQRSGLSAGDVLSVGLLYCREPGYACAIRF